MRRRLFWTITGVAVATGVLVIGAALFAAQRAAVDATYRELSVSAREAVSVVDNFVDRAGQRPGAAIEILRLLEDDELGELFSRIRRTAGGSALGFAVIDGEGALRTNSGLFDRLSLEGETVRVGEVTRTTSTTGELVVVTPTTVEIRGNDIDLLVALAREAPIVRLRDQGLGLALIFAGVVVLGAVAARLLADQLARRLNTLTDASKKVAAGDLTSRVPATGDPELDEVGGAFNEMASELATAREREREFILGVGHDLRTPLTTIGGYAEAMEAGQLTEEDLGRVGGVLGTQSRQLSRLIEDLTTLARLEQPEFSLRSEPVDVGAHVSEVVEGFRRRADEVGVHLEVAVAGDIVVETDPDRLGQIAANLVENALRHTPETGTIAVLVDQGETVELTVSDTGSGISAEDLPHIFDRHYVGRQRSVRKEGTGLGLSIVKGLVDRMGGSVKAESSPGMGTTITVTLS